MVLGYNICRYLESICEVAKVQLSAIINQNSKCNTYEINHSVSRYLQYIYNAPFFISPSLRDIKTQSNSTSLNSKFVLFSAPGATGKSTLAKHLSYELNALYWDLSKITIGDNSFAGSILNAIGSDKFSQFISDLNSGKVKLIIDAFDEAEIVSGRKMIEKFLGEINGYLPSPSAPAIYLLSRTETAQYIASYFTDCGIPFSHYEIGFFEESRAKEFVLRKVVEKGEASGPDKDSVNLLYDVIKNNIADEERSSFLGYAPVLEAMAEYIKPHDNRMAFISALSSKRDSVSIIIQIMDDLLSREQDKVTQAFRMKCEHAHPEFDKWENVYSPSEQLSRLVNYVVFNDSAYDYYPLDFLPPQLIDDYQQVLNSFLPQHPFAHCSMESLGNGSRYSFTGPAFRDYTIAKMLINQDEESLIDLFFENAAGQSYFPSQIFFDCYMNMSNSTILPGHISYVYDSFRAKATAMEYSYISCSENHMDDESLSCDVVFGMQSIKGNTSRRPEYTATIPVNGAPLFFDQLIGVHLNVPNVSLSIGRNNTSSRINGSTVICKEIKWGTGQVVFESYAPNGCLLVSIEGFAGDKQPLFEVTGDKAPRISIPNIKNYYKLYPFKYDFEDEANCDIIKFTHALHTILSEFRTHKKDTLAKTAERIDYVVVGKSDLKRKILAFLKECGVVYQSDHLYKIEESKMQEKGINFIALRTMDTEQMKSIYKEYSMWEEQ